jgi:hypothetical protein
MTWKQALATGLVGTGKAQSSDTCEQYKGRGGVQFVYFVKGKVEIIAVKASVRLARGIGVGDTYRQLHRAYPEREIGSGYGRAYLAAPGARIPANYRIGLDSPDVAFPDSKILEIALQSTHQSCYE